MTTTTGNQRHFSRVPFDARVRLIGSSGSTETQLLDISLKGALVKRPRDWEVQRAIPFTLELLLGGEEHIRMHVRFAHEESDRVGLCCEHIDVDSITHLRRLVQLNLGDPALLDRELAAMG